MSEIHPVYIPCASGNNAMTDTCVVRHGNLIRLLGHPQMDFTSDDARWLAQSILNLLGESDSAGDPLVDDVCADFQARSRLGQQKYGAKMTRDDLSLKDWIKHALEECLDQAVYLERLKRDVERTEDDGK